MSLLNLYVSPTRALMAVDTKAQMTLSDGTLDPDGTEVSKMLLLPHMSCATGVRGHMGLLSFVVASGLVNTGDFERLLELLPNIIAAGYDALKLQHAQMGLPSPEHGVQQLAVVGWSPRRQRMVGRLFEKAVNSSDFAAEEVDGTWLHDWDDSECPDAADSGTMARIAHKQMALVRASHPMNTPAGGRLVCATLTKGSVAASDLLDLEAEDRSND